MDTSFHFVGQTISPHSVVDAESATAERPVRYSSFVRLIAFFSLLILILSGCDNGSRPPRVGKVAPDFSVQDSDHRVMLRDFRGKIVVLNF
jgi:hypothetical protein